MFEHSADRSSKCIDTEEHFSKTDSYQRDPNCQREAEIWSQCHYCKHQKTCDQKHYLNTELKICNDSKDSFIEVNDHDLGHYTDSICQRETKNQCNHCTNAKVSDQNHGEANPKPAQKQ